MNILIQIPQLIFGGAEKVLVSFTNDLVSRGHNVEILETYEKGLLRDQFDSRVTFHSICSKEYTQKYYASLTQIRQAKGLDKLSGCGKLAFSKIVGYRRFAEKLAAKHYAERRFDVAINYLEIESPTFLLKNVKAEKYLQWYHTDVMNSDTPEETDALIPLYAKMDAVVCVSAYAYKNFVERYPEMKKKTHLIYNFFDVEAIRQKADEAFEFVGYHPVLLSVGRLTAEKQYPRFLDVLAKLRDEGICFSWHILGTGHQLDEIKQKISNLKLEDRVYLDGLTDNPYKYMKNCDLFVLPSGWEGFPTVTVEAKVLGCPVLATDVAGIREQLCHGKTGWIVENNTEGIYQGLKYLLQNLDAVDKIRSNAGMDDICRNDTKYNAFLRLLQ